LEIQGELLARHDNILFGGDGSAIPMGPQPTYWKNLRVIEKV
jgi:hypothetical protein